MLRHPTRPHIVSFTPDEVAEMVREKLRSLGVDCAPIGMQIVVEQPFAAGATVHSGVPGLSEVPGLTIILAGAGQ